MRIGAVVLLALIASVLGAQTSAPGTTQTPAAASQQSWFWFSEAGASGGNNIAGGLGVAMGVAAGQEILGELALETGQRPLGQASNLLLGVKSDYPQVTTRFGKITPFTLVAYGASIDTLETKKVVPPVAPGLNAATITAIGTGAGLAEQYGAGVQTTFGSWNVGLGYAGSRNGSAGWKGNPFLFISREFGK